jgi:TolB-like protein
VPAIEQHDVVFGSFRLDRRSRSLSREGMPIWPGGRALDVLSVLASAVGETVSKDTLFDQVWPGLTVEENNLQVQISALRRALGEGWIATIPGRGYRLTVPLTDAAPPPGAETLAGRPSIAVMAFTNMSGDPGQEFISDGIAEDIITALSHIRWLLVIARTSTFTYKNRTAHIRQVGRELGVRYVLEGSVRRSGDRLRITAQLIEAATGAHIWAERFDRGLADLFSVQDEITEAVVSAVEPTIADAERQRVGRKALESLDIWELYHRGLWHIFKYTPTDHRLALELLNKAVALDRGSVAVHAALGLTYLLGGRLFAPRDRAIWLTSGLEHARIAASLGPSDAMAHAIYGFGLRVSGDHKAAIDETMRAVALSIQTMRPRRA